MSITGLYMENIRCFHGKHYIPLKPLTILVGENSTGKTTILGTLSAFFQGAKTDWLTLNLNRPPFEFGRFEDIASFPNNQTERAIEFSIGLDIPGGEWYPFEDSATVVITFVNLDGEPVCRSIYVETQDIVYIIKRKSKNIWQYSLQDKNKLGGINTKSDQFYYKLVSSKLSRDLTDIETNDMSIEMGGLSGIIHQISEDATKAGLIDSPEQFQWPGMFLLGKLIKTFNPDIKNIAPIRIKPRRTYQSHEEIETAEGNHIPFVLERILRKKTNPKLISQIKEFGKASGLFR